MYKLQNIRATSIDRDLIADNHIATLITKRDNQAADITGDRTEIKKNISRTNNMAVILFDIEGRTFWCKEAEFATIKYALETFKDKILLYYITGSVSPYPNRTPLGSSGLDGYQLCILFC